MLVHMTIALCHQSDGSMKWSYTVGGYILSSPAVDTDSTIYFCTGSNAEKKVYAINPDGSFKWSYATDRPFSSSPVIGSDGTVYVGSADKQFYAINSDGSLKWSIPPVISSIPLQQ